MKHAVATAVVLFMGLLSAGWGAEEVRAAADEGAYLRIEASDASEGARFGASVALEGATAMVGAPGAGSGSVYVFRRSGASWFEAQKLEPSDAPPGAEFGRSLALSGEWLWVGAPSVDEDEPDVGAVYVFRRVSGVWSEFVKLSDPAPVRRESFGANLAVEGVFGGVGDPRRRQAARTCRSGDFGVVGVPGRSQDARVFLYAFDGTSWVSEGTLSPEVPQSEGYGVGVALGERWLVVGESTNFVDERVRIYRRTPDGPVFEAAVGGDPARSAQLGSVLSVRGDRIVAHAVDVDEPDGPDLVYVYERDGDSWARTTVLEGETGSGFGESLALGEELLLAGSPTAPRGDKLGEATVLAPAAAGSFWAVDRPVRVPSAQERVSALGASVALDPPFGIVGAPMESRPGSGLTESGFAYVVLATPCRAGAVGAGAGRITDVLFVNDSALDADRFVEVDEGESIVAGMLPAPAGGDRYVVHANAGFPDPSSVRPLPFDVGLGCFPFLLGDGAAPSAIWNNVGREGRVGSSRDFAGEPITDPDPAPAIFLHLASGDPMHLPSGTTVTFQGILRDADAFGPKGASATNAVTVRIR